MNKKIKTGIIGCGSRGIKNLGSKIIQQADTLGIAITALAEINPERLQEAATILNAAAEAVGAPAREFALYTDYQQMLDNEALDLVIITTPQNFHRKPFEAAILKGLKVYCDKPIAHTAEDAYAMLETWQKNGSKNAIIGFTRRYENAWREAFKIVQHGDIGEVKMLLLRAVIPFATYYHRWFSDSRLSGGVVNEKSAHHFDALQWFAQGRVKHVSGMGGRNIYLPRADHPGFCHRCEEICEYRRKTIGDAQNQMAADFFSTIDSEDIRYTMDRCVFDPDIDIFDHAIVNVSYDNGVKAQLLLDIAGFQAEDQETLEIIGNRGKIQLERHSAKLKVFRDYGRDIEEIDARDELHEQSHFGADDFLIQQISDLASGKITNPPAGPLEGAMATITATLARKSCKTMQVYTTDFDQIC
jgi:predicted dehydrogenase